MTEERETYNTPETALTTRQELSPSIWRMLQEIDQATYESRRFGATRGETAIKLIFCLENGLPLSAANTGLYIVNSRLGVMGNVIAASIRKHPDYDYFIKRLDDKGCTIEIGRREGGETSTIGEATFDETMAKRADLLKKDNWEKYPEDMYFNRAISRAYKLFCPDIFSQPVYVPEELDGSDAIETEWNVVTPHTEYKAEPTLEDLLQLYSAEAIMEANEGRIPGTDEEVKAVAVKLEEATKQPEEAE